MVFRRLIKFCSFTDLLTHPIPQSEQQVSRSSAEISKLTLPLLWIQILSDIASAAPKACKIGRQLLVNPQDLDSHGKFESKTFKHRKRVSISP